MDLLEKIKKVEKTINETDQLLDEILLSFENNKNKLNQKELEIAELKEEIKHNIQKIDLIIKNYNADT